MKSIAYGILIALVVTSVLSFFARLFFDIESLSETRSVVFGSAVWLVGIIAGIHVGRSHARRSRE